MKRECETCIKRKTLYCPSTNECMNTDDMSYYQNRIMLLEENKNLKENYERIYNENCILREKHNINDIDLLDENNQLKNNWNKLREWTKEYEEGSYGRQ